MFKMTLLEGWKLVKPTMVLPFLATVSAVGWSPAQVAEFVDGFCFQQQCKSLVQQDSLLHWADVPHAGCGSLHALVLLP
jgi:hypothetical protein